NDPTPPGFPAGGRLAAPPPRRAYRPPSRVRMHTSQPADPTVRPILLAIALGLAWTSGVGCRRSDDATLTIATDLDGPALAGLAADFASRAADRGEPAPAIRWARTSPGVDPARWLRNGAGADVVL